jgi:hypothetical protein
VSSAEWIQTLSELNAADEARALEMLRAEQHGKCRQAYVFRIYGRYNLLRGERERRELLAPAQAAAATTQLPAGNAGRAPAKPLVNTLPAKVAAQVVQANGTFPGKPDTIYGVLLGMAQQPITMGALLTAATANPNLKLPRSKKNRQWVVRSYVAAALTRRKYLTLRA